MRYELNFFASETNNAPLHYNAQIKHAGRSEIRAFESEREFKEVLNSVVPQTSVHHIVQELKAVRNIQESIELTDEQAASFGWKAKN